MPDTVGTQKMIYKNPLIVEQVSNPYYNPIITSCLTTCYQVPLTLSRQTRSKLQTENRGQ